LDEIGNEYAVMAVKFVTSKKLPKALCPHVNYIHSGMSSDGKIVMRLITVEDRRGNSSIVDTPYFRGAYCGIDYSLEIAKFRERLSVRKRVTEDFKVRFGFKKLNNVNVKEQNTPKCANSSVTEKYACC
jgi:hypothetical protein